MSDCINSVLMQDTINVEHIVMDGGSDDETLQILESFSSDSRLRWISEPDNGQSDALNKAYKLSTGDWIGWLNADEFYLPGTLTRVAECIQANPESDLIHGDFTEVDVEGRITRLVAEHGFSKRALQALCYIPSCATFVRRDALPARLWDVQCRSMMDWDLYLELYTSGKNFVHIKRPMAAFRVHADQVTASVGAQSLEEFSRIRARHGIPLTAPALETIKVLGRSAHIFRKFVEGSYIREVRASRLRGRSLRWFDDVDDQALRSLGAARMQMTP